LFATSLFFAATAASAQNVTFNGFTNGKFCSLTSISCVNPNTSAFQNAVNQRLTWTNSTFNASVPDGGSFTLNAPAAPYPTQNVNNFGAFYLGGRNIVYNTPFTLWITFTQPASTVLAYAAQITGTISGVNGNLTIDFGPNTQNMSFAGGNGWAAITVNDVLVPGESTTSMTGVITAQVVPEPMTVTLLATGLLGLAGAAVRRRRKQNNDLA
jgi:hypothetical protein